MKKINMLFVLIPFLLITIGCGKSHRKAVEGSYDIYYMNRNGTGLEKEVYEAEYTDPENLIEELLYAMQKPEDEKTHMSLLDEKINIQKYRFENGNVELNMKAEYKTQKRTREVLIRAGLVRTLVQIEGVDTVSFQVGGSPLLDSDGQPVGFLNAQSFIENSGKEINSYKSETLTLYFSNEEGNGLKAETRKMYYNSNVSLEQVVVEQLLKGPKTGGCYKTLPDNAKVMNVTVVDKICYVNFDKTFADAAVSVQEQIPIYSIVNSIIENCSVNKVQISIDGESDRTFRETMKLSELYKMNRDLIQKDAE